jgi:hypothetical protein
VLFRSTEYIPTTTSIRTRFAGITQDGGSASNIPRLDYTNGSCPSILVEPQRTNVYLNSDNFLASDGISGCAITSDVEISPDGNMNADKMQGDGSASTFQLFNNITIASSTIYTFSLFAKAGNTNFVELSCTNMDIDTNAVFDLSLGTITLTGASSSPTITNYGNGWYRCSIQMVAQTTDLSGRFRVYVPADGSGGAWADSNGKNLFLYGRQLEAGSNATSYIPTVASAVTRNADLISKTGISDLIGQTEGTMYAEVNLTTQTESVLFRRIIMISNGDESTSSYLRINSSNIIQFVSFNGTAQCVITSLSSFNGTIKVAAAYKENDFVLYINGVLQGSDNLGTIPASRSILRIGNSDALITQHNLNDRINSAILWKERLSNETLAQLTTL